MFSIVLPACWIISLSNSADTSASPVDWEHAVPGASTGQGAIKLDKLRHSVRPVLLAEAPVAVK